MPPLYCCCLYSRRDDFRPKNVTSPLTVAVRRLKFISRTRRKQRCLPGFGVKAFSRPCCADMLEVKLNSGWFSRSQEIENQTRLKKLNLNLILVCHRYTVIVLWFFLALSLICSKSICRLSGKWLYHVNITNSIFVLHPAKVSSIVVLRV